MNAFAYNPVGEEWPRTSDEPAPTIITAAVSVYARPGQHAAYLVLSKIGEPGGFHPQTDSRELAALQRAVSEAMSGKLHEQAYACGPTWVTDFCAYVGSATIDRNRLVTNVIEFYRALSPDGLLQLEACECASTDIHYCPMARRRLSEADALHRLRSMSAGC